MSVKTFYYCDNCGKEKKPDEGGWKGIRCDSEGFTLNNDWAKGNTLVCGAACATNLLCSYMETGSVRIPKIA